MAKRITKKEVSGPENLVDRIKKLDNEKFERVSVVVRRDKAAPAGFQQEFREQWHDGNRFSDGFGKSPA